MASTFCFPRLLALFVSMLLFTASAYSQDVLPDKPIEYDDDSAALILARRYMEGGEGARAALLDALQRMGWGVRDAKGAVIQAPPAEANTGLAFRDYELEELLWSPTSQPTIRMISMAQALAVPFEDADAEELAQDLLTTVRRAAESSQPQRRFWGRFIIALGRVSPAGYDLGAPGPAPVVPPSQAALKQLERDLKKNPMLIMQNPNLLSEATRPSPLWQANDPVLAPSPLPKRAEGDDRETSAKADQRRMKEISDELQKIASEMNTQDTGKQQALQERMNQLGLEMGGISQRQQIATMHQLATSSAKKRAANDDDEEEEETDEEEDEDAGSRFIAEWRDQPLCMLQVVLISRVLAADVRQAALRQRPARADVRTGLKSRGGLPLAMLFLAQARPATDVLGDQIAGAGGDIWATAWGAYTGELLDKHLPENRFSKGVAVANVIIAWYKTIMTVCRQQITIEVVNAPLVRTKTRSPGEQRTARATVIIDFPKSDTLKALRAAANLTTLDLQLPDGGPVSGAKVVWRLPEGSYNGKYQTSKGDWEYRPDLAVVQFAQAGSNAAYISSTDANGVATITIEGAPQRKMLSPTVRPYPRRAAVGVEVTVKVGNITQDLNDAINTALGGPVGGGLGFIADMVLRTSFFFHKTQPFPVTDWKEPTWAGEFEITIKGSGSKTEKGEKGGPPVTYTWSMDRYMEGRLETPEWEEENEAKNEYVDGDRIHRLEVNGDSRYFRLTDSSSAKSRRTNNRYSAKGPYQLQPPGYNQFAKWTRSEPSGSATLRFSGNKIVLNIEPFFGAQCWVERSEQSGSRSSSKSGLEYLSLADVISTGFSAVTDYDGKQEEIQGEQSHDFYMGNLPYVEPFPVVVTLKYRLWKNGPVPKNK